MAQIFYSNASGSDSNDGSTPALAVLTFNKALSLAGTPGIILADSASSETLSTSASTTFTGGTTPAAKVEVISVDFSASTQANPVAKAGAKITPGTGFNLTWAGYWKFIDFSSVTGGGSSGSIIQISNSVASDIEFAGSAAIVSASTQLGAGLNMPSSFVIGHVTMRDTPAKAPASRAGKFKFAATAQTITVGSGQLDLRNMLMLTSDSAVPTSLFTLAMGRVSAINAEDVDFTNLTGATYPFIGNFRNCVIPSGVALLKSGSVLAPGARISFVRCSSVGAGASNRVIAYEGVQEEVTDITLVGGATDGTTLRSWHLKSSATGGAFEAHPVMIANDQTGSALTVAIEALWAGSTAPTNDKVWIEVEALTDSGRSLGVLASTGVANSITTPAAYAVSPATWNGDLTSKTRFRMSVSITPAQIGAIKATVKMSAAAAAEMWFDPKPIVSGGAPVSRSVILPSGAMFNETGAITIVPTNVYVPVPGRSRSR